MAQLYASWVHGSSLVPDLMGNPPLELVDNRPFTDVTGWRRGDGIFFRIGAKQQLWIHAPIPTPVIVEGKRATLGRVMAFFDIQGGQLDLVQVTDGNNVIFRSIPLKSSGNHITTGLNVDQ